MIVGSVVPKATLSPMVIREQSSIVVLRRNGFSITIRCLSNKVIDILEVGVEVVTNNDVTPVVHKEI
jgi:hypothetical protein